MRTTLDLDDRLLAAAKREAAGNRTTLTAFVEAALAAALVQPNSPSGKYRLIWKTRRGRSRPTADIADRDRLLDAMEGRG